MCKRKENQNRVINRFFEKLRGESYSRPFAIYERCEGNTTDLIGFAAFVEGVLNFFEVRADESIRVVDMVPYPAMGANGIANHFGGDFALAI